MEVKERDNHDEYSVIKESTPEHIKEFIKDVMFSFDDSIGSLDMTYAIAHSALRAMSDVEYDKLEEFDAQEYSIEHASVYTGVRLSYLNPNNQQEISDTMKEYSCDDIATACAIWYDNAVNHFLGDLLVAIKQS